MSKRYLFSFRPMDSFSFSGETSARTRGVTDDFFANAPNASRRQSFRVDTDLTPPQTTVLGAVRRMLFGRYDIGPATFNIGRTDEQPMGVIQGLSAVFLMGQSDQGQPVVCIPAPAGVMKDDGYQPAAPEAYRAKAGTEAGFLCYEGGLTGQPQWRAEKSFFKTYEQAAIHIGDGAKADGYHLQRKCRLTNTPLTDLRFCVIAEVDDAVQPVPPMLLALGGKDSRFQCTMEATALNLAEVNAGCYPQGKQYWCLSLLSAACLPEGWRDADGLAQAFVTRRDMRCALADKDKGYAMQLIDQKLVLADKGSAFLFDSAAARDAFAKAIRADHRRLCGLNQVLLYETGTPEA